MARNENTASKRRKLDDGRAASNHAVGDIQSSDQLRELLIFQQDAAPRLRQNLRSFKSFLDSIAYGEEGPHRSAKQFTLLQYLRAESRDEGDGTTNYLADLIQTWSYAAQANNDGLLSAVPAVLALLLKTISALIDFRDHGIRLCKTLLRRDQLQLLSNGLSANKVKEHVISPCLRLLTEVTSFDGGSAARSLFLHRDVTFMRLETFLSLHKTSPARSPEERRKPSIRSNAMRYILANLRFQDNAAKSDILSQLHLVRGIFQGLKDDASEMILEMFDVFKKYIVMDDQLHRAAKCKLFTDWTLGRIATLYSYEEYTNEFKEESNIRIEAHKFLLSVCTTVDKGALFATSGWYHIGNDPASTRSQFSDGLSLHDTNESQEKHAERSSIRNTTLAYFIQTLRPFADVLHKELVLAIFKAAPELVADYFLRTSFSFEPKLSTTWVGYSAFLLSTVQLPIPSYHNLQDGQTARPPPVSTVIESILPNPLNKTSLTRCLNQRTELATFFAVGVMVAAFQKLRNVLELFRSAKEVTLSTSEYSWEAATSELVAEFSRRCPAMKHVVAVFRGSSKDNVVLREAVTRLLVMYYKLIPQVALDEKLDLSLALSTIFKECSDLEDTNREKLLIQMTISHLLIIAHRCPDIRWWHKPDQMPLSPFTAILRTYVSNVETGSRNETRGLLSSILFENGILQQETSVSSFDALYLSLKDSRNFRASVALYSFLDNCILRLARRPIKYLGDLTSFTTSSTSTSVKGPASLLLMALVEQWPFFSNASDDFEIVDVSCWLARYLKCSKSVGENSGILVQTRDRIASETSNEEARSIFQGSLEDSEPLDMPEEPVNRAQVVNHEVALLSYVSQNSHGEAQSSTDVQRLRSVPSEEDENHLGLTRWRQEDILDAIEGGALGDLILCLCSMYLEVRKQAFLGLRAFMAEVKKSDYIEWKQIYVLLGEVAETTGEPNLDEPFPYFAGAIAVQCCVILARPLHLMYEKINKFLNRSPFWDTAKLPSYWIDKILLQPPIDDDGHYLEVEWLLDALLDGLQTATDMNAYRKNHVFERLLSLSASPLLPESCFAKIVQILYRCTYVEGSTTLITRCGVLSWIRTGIASGGRYELVLRDLLAQLYKTCEQNRVDEWGNGSVSGMVDSLRVMNVE